MLYHQIGTDIAAQSLPCSEADAIRLAVMKLQAKVSLKCERFRLDLRSLLPMKNLRLRPAAEWKGILLKRYHEWVNSDANIGSMDSTQTQECVSRSSAVAHSTTHPTHRALNRRQYRMQCACR